MGLRRFDWSCNITSRLDLLRRHLWHPVWIFLGLDSRSLCRVGCCCSDDLFVALGRSGDPLFHLSRFWGPPRIAGLHRSVDSHLCHRNSLVVAYGPGLKSLGATARPASRLPRA